MLPADVTPRTPWTGWTGGCSRAARWECRWPSTIATPPGEQTTAEEGGRGPRPETGGGTGAGPGADPGATTDTGAGSREAEADQVQSLDQDQETKNIASRSISTYTGNVMVTLPTQHITSSYSPHPRAIHFIHSFILTNRPDRSYKITKKLLMKNLEMSINLLKWEQ